MNPIQFLYGMIFFVAGTGLGFLFPYLKYVKEKKKARKDYLTKLFNYREFDARLKKLLKTECQDVALALIDLDYFKRINDRFSYATGDQVLAHVAEILSLKIRTTDQVYRFKSGDEFAILFKDIYSAFLIDIGERLRSTIENTPFSFENQTVYLTASIGLTMVQKEDTKESLITRVERALKEAKGRRNRVLVL